MRRILRGVIRRFNNFFDRFVLYEIDLTTYQYPPGLPDELVLRRITPDEFKAMASDPVYEISDYLLKNSLEIMARGDECWVVEHRGQIGHYVIAQLTSRHLGIKCSLPIAPDTVYMIRGFTVARMRGQRLAPTTIALLALHYREMGYRRFLVDISRHNIPSTHCAVPAGWRPIGSFRKLTIGRHTVALVSRRTRRIISGPAD